jgi:hypothetical protein
MKYYIGAHEGNLEEKIAEDAYTYYSEGGDRFYNFTGTAWEEITDTLASHGFTEVEREVYEAIREANPSLRIALSNYLIYSGDTPFPQDAYNDKYISYFQELTNTIHHILTIKNKLP